MNSLLITQAVFIGIALLSICLFFYPKIEIKFGAGVLLVISVIIVAITFSVTEFAKK
jgi:hypothetical protein